MSLRISTRLVILTRTRAIKIPIDRRGWIQGHNEKRTWDRYKHTGLLAPIRWTAGPIVCQQRITPVTKITSTAVAAIRQAIPHLNIANCDLHNPANWGQHRGSFLLLDYGISARVAKMYPKKNQRKSRKS